MGAGESMNQLWYGWSHDGLYPASKPNELHTRQRESCIKREKVRKSMYNTIPFL